jgi:hypothetical protein
MLPNYSQTHARFSALNVVQLRLLLVTNQRSQQVFFDFAVSIVPSLNFVDHLCQFQMKALPLAILYCIRLNFVTDAG